MEGARFHPVQASSHSTQVVEQISGQIQRGELAPGARLPSERELAGQFGVSRPTVREAIRALASLRLLEVRQGRGTFVSVHATTAEDPSFWLPWLTEHHADVLALLEVREALEVKSAALAAMAAARHQPETVKALQSMALNIDAMAQAAQDHDLAALEQLDLEFHALLAEMARNRYLQRLARSVNHVLADRRAVLAIPGRAQQSVEQHRQVAAAVRAGDPAAAAAAMTRHMESTKAQIRELK